MSDGLDDAFELLALIIIGHSTEKPHPNNLKRGKLNIKPKENACPKLSDQAMTLAISSR